MFLCTPVNSSSRVPPGVPPTSSTNFLPRYWYLQLTLQHAATNRFSRIEKSFAVSLTQENPCLLAKQTNLSEANALTKKIGVNGRSLSVVWCTSLWDWRTVVFDFVMGFQKRGFFLTVVLAADPTRFAGLIRCLHALGNGVRGSMN